MSFTPERLVSEVRAYERSQSSARNALVVEVPRNLLKTIADALERNAAAQDIVHAACTLIASDINIHPCMSREEAVRSGYDKLEAAVGKWIAAQPAQQAIDLPQPQANTGHPT